MEEMNMNNLDKSKISIIGGSIAVVCGLISLIGGMILGEFINLTVDITLFLAGGFLIFSGIWQKRNKK